MDKERFIYKPRLNISWLMRMAWRDSRRNWSRLFLFISSIILGIAALVAIFSLGENAQKDIDTQAKTLVGADLAIESNRPVSVHAKSLLDSLGKERSRERNFASMIYFIKNQGSRLVQVRALDGNYPFYGSLETTPAPAGKEFRKNRQALVDQTLMLQFDARVGDSIKIGAISFAIAGILNKAPGRTALSTTIAPPVYIPLQYLEQTGLIQKGSRISYNYYYRFDPSEDMDRIISTLGPRLEKEGLDYETVASRKKSTGRVFEDFNRFLTLISFIALLLGCIGVASSIHIYIREKIHSIAILRCLGTSGIQAFLIYLLQVSALGLIGSFLGALLGTVVQQVLPAVLKNFLPIELSSGISWPSVAKGMGLGMIISLLFALLPLLSIRNVSPLGVLRFPVEQNSRVRDPLKGILYILIFFFVTLFARQQMQSWKQGLVFTTSILCAFLFLVLLAWSLRWLVRRFFPSSWNYLWRQGFANLYRPNNQTLILLTTIGLGTAFIGTLYFVHSILVNRVTLSAGRSQPNMVLFDVQTSQTEALTGLAKQYHVAVFQQIVVVTMRIEQINDKTPAELKSDTASGLPRRAFEGELRVSFRDSLSDSEKITAGSWEGRVHLPKDPIPISIEEQYARRVHLKIGDRILFNVQGMLIHTVIGSLRQVDWRRLQTNFRVIFPAGVLEAAPQFHVISLRVPSNEVSARFQRAVVQNFPNVSIIDLGLVLRVLDDVLDKVGFVIRFMAGFSILTGFIVLLASVLISKYQRMQEMVLLRAMGASRRQILTITALEYFFLGALAAATGILMSLVGSWALAKYSFDASFTPEWWPVIGIFLLVSSLTILIGLLNSREVINKPPLEILRKDT